MSQEARKLAIQIKNVSKTFYPLSHWIPYIGNKKKGFKSVEDISMDIFQG